MARDSSAHNFEVMKVRTTRFAEKRVRPGIIKMLCEIADRMVKLIDRGFSPVPPYESELSGNSQFPVWRGHLRDATGVGVYDNGRLMRYVPVKKGIKTQKHEGIKKIIGSDWLRKALDEGVSKFGEGIWLVLFSAVPYAEEINEYGSPKDRGVGFFDKLSEEMMVDILVGIDNGVYKTY